MVDLPTPPLPAQTAMMCLTRGRGLSLAAACWGVALTWAENSTSTLVTSGRPETAATTSALILSYKGQAGVVSSTVTGPSLTANA